MAARKKTPTQETLALLKILARGKRQVEDGKVVPAREAIARLREKKRGPSLI
jgi:hypothetical protein